MINFESKSVGELRAKLVESGKFTEEQALAVKGKSLVVFEVKKLLASGDLREEDFGVVEPVAEPEDELLNSIETMTEEMLDIAEEKLISGDNQPDNITPVTKAMAAPQKLPKVTSPEWQEFVLSQFTSDEVLDINGNTYPTVSGLRRVAELLLGEIIFSGPINVFPSADGESTGRASVLYRVDISWHLNVAEYMDIESGLPIRTFQSCAEAWDESIKDPRFKPFPLTIAETRAEGRALRKALFLKTLAAEEISGSEMPTKETVNAVMEYDENAPITSSQLGIIRAKCLQFKIDVDKFAPGIESFTKQHGTELIKKINSFQQGVEKVPEELLIKE